MNLTKNLFIVIDGTDGSGKATQTQLLLERLEQEGHKVKTISFPQYKQKSAGLVEEYLSGKYGTSEEVGPKIGSIFYAIDRFDASFQIRAWLEEGYTVITDRYATSNMGHQGGKISEQEHRQKFFEWNHELEHDLFGIPVPDLCVVLHVPTTIAMQLAKDRGGWKADIKTDIHETDEDHMSDAEKAYLHLADFYPNTHLVSCAPDGAMRSRKDIHEEIIQIIESK